MFLVFSKEKIQTYLVSILTVAVLIGIANIDSIKTIPTSSTEKYHPVSVTIPELDVTIPVENDKVQFAMPHFDITLNVNTEATLRNVAFVGSEHLTPVLYEKVDGAYVATATNAGIYDNTYYVKVNSTNIEQYQVYTIDGSFYSQGSSYSSTLTLTLNTDGYYEFKMPKVELSKTLTITVTEKDMTLFAGQSFVGTYVGLNSCNSSAKTSWSGSYGFTIDSAGIVTKGSTLTPFTSYDAEPGLLTNSDKSKAAVVADGKMTATIVWSSSHYDYMLVDGERCDVLSTENGSTFEIPVAALDTPLAVVGDTTAMSTPHEIDYTLTFDASSAEVNG